MSLLKKLFGGTSVNFAELVKQGAMIIDVRSPAEFKGGHVKGAVNMPLQSLQVNMSKIPKNKTIITCCASGMRSGSASGARRTCGWAGGPNAARRLARVRHRRDHDQP